MKAAINTLEIALENLETNEEVHRKDGDHDQANRDSENATEHRHALAILKTICDWPE